MRVLVCAGRYFADAYIIRKVLDNFHKQQPVQVLIHGGNQFLGSAFEDWARDVDAHVVRYPANWHLHGKLAERRRNQFMLQDSRPDVLIAFPGGEETTQLVIMANQAGIEVLISEQQD